MRRLVYVYSKKSRKTLVMFVHTWTMRLYALQWTSGSLEVSLWAKLHLLIEMREQKESILEREAECSGGGHSFIA